MRAIRVASALCVVAFVAACEGEGSIHRPFDVNRDVSLALDAQQRVVINNKRNAAGDSARVICAEPSPDVATAIAKSFTSSLTAGVRSGATDVNVAATLARNFAQSLVQLGERTVAIQLLRDALYRACEAYSNNAIDTTEYALLLSRFDTLAATLVTSELGAGAVGRALAAISGSAGQAAEPGTADKELLDNSRKALEDARKALSDAQIKENEARAKKEQADKEKSVDSIASTSEALRTAELTVRTRANELSDRQRDLDQVEARVRTRTGPVGGPARPGGGSGSIGAVSEHVSTAMMAMQRQYFAHIQSDIGPLIATCISSLNNEYKPIRVRVDPAAPGQPPVYTPVYPPSNAFKPICQIFLGNITSEAALRQSGLIRLATTMASICVSFARDSERATCQRQVSAILVKIR